MIIVWIEISLMFRSVSQVHKRLTIKLIYHQTSSISLNSVCLLITQMRWEHRLLVLHQLHLHSRLNTWLQWNGQRERQHEPRNIYLGGVVRLILCKRVMCSILFSKRKFPGRSATRNVQHTNMPWQRHDVEICFLYYWPSVWGNPKGK